MLEIVKKNVGHDKHIAYKVINIQDISYNDGTFDIVIANMMLYYVTD